MMISRDVVERTFPDGLHIPINDEGAKTCSLVGERNADLNVTWVHSHINEDKTKTYCVYDGPNPKVIREVAQQNGLPVDLITRVTVLDPHFYR